MDERRVEQAARQAPAIPPQTVEHARQLVNHPGWQMYVDQLDEAITGLTQTKTNLVSKMTDTGVMGSKLSAIKLLVVGVESQINAYKAARDWIPSILEKATKESQ